MIRCRMMNRTTAMTIHRQTGSIGAHLTMDWTMNPTTIHRQTGSIGAHWTLNRMTNRCHQRENCLPDAQTGCWTPAFRLSDRRSRPDLRNRNRPGLAYRHRHHHRGICRHNDCGLTYPHPTPCSRERNSPYDRSHCTTYWACSASTILANLSSPAPALIGSILSAAVRRTSIN